MTTIAAATYTEDEEREADELRDFIRHLFDGEDDIPTVQR